MLESRITVELSSETAGRLNAVCQKEYRTPDKQIMFMISAQYQKEFQQEKEVVDDKTELVKSQLPLIESTPSRAVITIQRTGEVAPAPNQFCRPFTASRFTHVNRVLMAAGECYMLSEKISTDNVTNRMAPQLQGQERKAYRSKVNSALCNLYSYYGCLVRVSGGKMNEYLLTEVGYAAIEKEQTQQ